MSTRFLAASRGFGVLCVVFAATGALPAAAKATFTKVKFPHNNLTQMELINSNGAVAGQHGTGFAGRAFIRTPDGAFTDFAIDGAVVTIPRGLTDEGAVGGRYDLPDDSIHGFLRDTAGNLTPFDGPGLGAAEIDGMNASNDIAGTYFVNTDGVLGGFIRHPDGTLTTFRVHGSHDRGLRVAGIDDKGNVAGDYSDSNFVSHTFLRNPLGEILKFQAPSAATQSFGDGTGVLAISSKGWMTGYFTDKSGAHRQYLRDPDGKFTEFDRAGGSTGQTTAVNDQGDVTGWYSVAFHLHGFVRKASGKFVTFDLPWGETENMGVQSINDSGQVAGYAYYGTFGKREVGFIRTP